MKNCTEVCNNVQQKIIMQDYAKKKYKKNMNLLKQYEIWQSDSPSPVAARLLYIGEKRFINCQVF